MKYQVVVGNIGTVYDDDSIVDAGFHFVEYRTQSQSGIGRAAYETVTLLVKGEIKEEYVPYIYPAYLVVCKDDDSGMYVLATRQVFLSRLSAKEYMETISPSRKPMLVGCLAPLEIVRG